MQQDFEETYYSSTSADSSSEEGEDIGPRRPCETLTQHTREIYFHTEALTRLANRISKARYGSNLRLRRYITHKISEVEHLLIILNTEIESEV